MLPSLPIVSVGLPVYNEEQRIEHALQSLVEQTYPNIEIIVCDDASTDRTPEVCAGFAKKYSFIRFVRNEANLGAHHNFKKTLDMAIGEYFLWADQDDYWDPEFVSTLVAELEKDSEVIGAMCGVSEIWTDGIEGEPLKFSSDNKPQENSHFVNAISVVAGRYKKTIRLKNNLFIHGIVRRSSFKNAIESYPGVFQNERQIVCQLALSGRLVFVDKMLFRRTRHRRPLKERRQSTDARVIAQSKPFPIIRYIYGLTVAILRSSIIPWYRKLYLPILIYYFWKTQIIMMIKRFPRRILVAVAQTLPTPVYERLKRQWKRLRL